MKSNIQVIMHKFSVIVVISSLAISAIICAPQQAQQQSPSASPVMIQQQGPQNSVSVQSLSNSQRQQSATSPTTSTTTSSTSAVDQSSLDQSSSSASSSAANEQPSTNPLFSSDAQLSADQKDGAQLASGNTESAQPDEAGELDLFDGKNPFTDSSLWQIPLQLVNDFSSPDAAKQAAELLANSASETSSLSDDDDEEPAQSAQIHSPQSGPAPKALQQASPEPVVVLGSSDLKTAAGYHYPTHNSHHGGHHGGGYHGGHGYFQYASVPKPKAWEFGYKRGNSKHTIERYEKGHGPHFSTKVKWSDKHGHGVHTWEYNHDDHHSHHDDHYDDHHHHHEPHHGYQQKKQHHHKHY